MEAPQTPRFRTDLVATPLEIEGKRFIDVTDPESEQTFRFYEVEYSVACAMDGQRDMNGLVRWSKEELGLEPSLDEIETVVSTLQELGYLDAAGGSGGIELGSAGPSESQEAPAIQAGDVELGGSGASPIAPPRPDRPAEAAKVELGLPGKPSMPPAGKVTMGWDAPPVDPKELEQLMGKDSLGPAGLAAKAAAAQSGAPVAGKVTMGWDAPSVDPKELEQLMAKSDPAEPVPSLKPTTKPDDDEDGPTQIPDAIPEYDDEDLSVDLSDHLSIGTEDVKEAVRQSKTMDAVQVPDDLLAELEDQPTKTGEQLEVAAKSEPAVLKPEAEQKKPAPAPKAAPKAAGPDPSKPVALPDKPPKISKDEPKAAAAEEVSPEEKTGGGGGTLILFLILVLAAGGAGAYYFLVYNKQADGPNKPTAGQTKRTTKKTPRGKPVISSKLAESDPDVAEVLAVAGGVIANIAVAGDEVDEGAVVASLKGVAQVERSLARPRRKLVEYAKKLDEAKASGASARTIARLQAKVDEKKGLVIAGNAKLEALQMYAPVAGVVEPLIEAGANVNKDDPVAQIVGSAGLSATFPTKKKFEVGGACEIAPAKDRTKVVPCKIDSIEPGKVTIRIPQDVGFAAGDSVVLR